MDRDLYTGEDTKQVTHWAERGIFAEGRNKIKKEENYVSEN